MVSCTCRSRFDNDEQLHDRRHGHFQRRRLLSAWLYRPGLAMPVMLGVLIGSFTGARALERMQSRALRIAFAIVAAGMFHSISFELAGDLRFKSMCLSM